MGSSISTQNWAANIHHLWGDNNFVKTLLMFLQSGSLIVSNFHSPKILTGSLKRKQRNPVTKQWDLQQSPVDCPKQVQAYCNNFHAVFCAQAPCKQVQAYCNNFHEVFCAQVPLDWPKNDKNLTHDPHIINNNTQSIAYKKNQPSNFVPSWSLKEDTFKKI